MTSAMMGTMTFRALSIHSRRILDFLMFENASHAGMENGNLGATYRQLAAWGVTAADVRKGFEELFVTGFVELTKQGARQAGGGEPSRYALTWLPTLHGTVDAMPPAHTWLRVNKRLYDEGRRDLSAVKSWLKGQTALHRRRLAKKQNLTPHLRVVSPIKCEASR